MSKIETYNTEAEAQGARDHYNHNLDRRAEYFKLPGVGLTDFGGGSYDEIFKSQNNDLWVLVVES